MLGLRFDIIVGLLHSAAPCAVPVHCNSPQPCVPLLARLPANRAMICSLGGGFGSSDDDDYGFGGGGYGPFSGADVEELLCQARTIFF